MQTANTVSIDLLKTFASSLVKASKLGSYKGLIIYNPAVGVWSNSKCYDKHFERPSQSQKILFDTPHIKDETLLTPLI